MIQSDWRLSQVVSIRAHVILPSLTHLDSQASGNTRRNRCSDRFVRYPYPKCLNTYYQKEYPGKNGEVKVVKPKDAFNIEKEHKIINPHPMDMSTTQKTSYQGYSVKPSEKKMRQA